MRRRFTLLKTIPSNSHNAHCDEQGYHWPKGQQFYLMSRWHQRQYGSSTSTVFEQIGGEEVIVILPNSRIVELFGKEV